MEIQISPEELKAIERLAARNDNNSLEEQAREMLVDAVRCAIDHDRWFRVKVREGARPPNAGSLSIMPK